MQQFCKIKYMTITCPSMIYSCRPNWLNMVESRLLYAFLWTTNDAENGFSANLCNWVIRHWICSHWGYNAHCTMLLWQTMGANDKNDENIDILCNRHQICMMSTNILFGCNLAAFVQSQWATQHIDLHKLNSTLC